MASVELKDVSKEYDNKQSVLKNFDLTIHDKEFLVLVGPSGCGKSTVLRMIAGLENLSNGELYIDECLMNDVESKDRNIAMIFQNYSLYGHMSVYQNIAFSLQIRKTPKKLVKQQVYDIAKALEIEELLPRKPKELSGGQRQRVAMGRAMVRNPSVFLLDEPLSNLDAQLRDAMRLEIKKLHQAIQTTFIYVTHDQTEAMTLGERIVIMKDGIIQQVGTPKLIYEEPENMFVAGFIGVPQMNFIEGILCYDEKRQHYYIKVQENCFYLWNTSVCPSLEKYIEQPIIMGIRPEHIFTEMLPPKDNQYKELRLEVELLEMVGHAKFLHLNFNNKSLIIKAKPNCLFKINQVATVYIDMTKIYLFDSETQRKIKI